MQLPAYTTDWPDPYRDNFRERAAHMEYDGGLRRDVAERRAEADIRSAALAGGVVGEQLAIFA